MIKLSAEQMDFLKDEFGIESRDLKNMTIEKWNEIRFKAFDIEAELLPDKNRGQPSKRCMLATSIIDAKVDFKE